MAAYEKIFLSKTFKFVVGLEKKKFILHEAALSRLSRPLDRLLNGSMSEAREHRVIWDDLDESTFLGFAQWSYGGVYNTPDPDILPGAPQVATPAPTASTTKRAKKKAKISHHAQPARQASFHSLSSLASRAIIDTTSTSKPCRVCHDPDNSSLVQDTTCESCNKTFACAYCHPCEEYQSTKCGPCQKKDTISGRCQLTMNLTVRDRYPPPGGPSTPRKKIDAREDYTEVFLTHARLYVMADKYDIQTLRRLALHKLWATLRDFTLVPGRVNDVVSLITYAYGAFSQAAADDPMCLMLAEYSACIFEELVQCDEWKTLGVRLPVFLACMLEKIAGRLA